MNEYFTESGFNTNALLNTLGDLILALIVLFAGYLIAKAIGKAVEKLLYKTGVVKRFRSPRSSSVVEPQKAEREEKGNKWPPEKVAGTIVFYILMVFVLILFFNILNLNIIASPLVDMVSTMLAFIPNVLTAALILLLGYVIALVLRTLVVKAGHRLAKNKSVRDNKYVKDSGNLHGYVDNLGTIVFYVILLMFLPGVLGALGINAVSEPFSNMLQSFLAFIPRLVAAALIFFIGWIVAKIVRDIVSNFLHAVGTDKLSQRLGFSNFLKETTLSSIIGTVVFVLIMIPVTISALDQLQIQGITGPAINMLNDVMAMIPNIIIAIALILVGLWIGKWVRRFVADLLSRLSFNNVTNHLKVGGWKASQSRMTPADIVGYIVQAVVVILFIVEAFQIAGLDFLVSLGTAVLAFLPSVITAVVILALGIILGNIVKRILESLFSGSELSVLSSVAKYAIMALALFMALDQLGVADTIVTSAFVLILGALALAFGLAFGLGGRENASRYLDKMERKAERTEISRERAQQTAEEIKNEYKRPARDAKSTDAQRPNQRKQNPSSLYEAEDLPTEQTGWDGTGEDLSNDTSAWDNPNNEDDSTFGPDDLNPPRR
ncbi:mechanosensitive ion channel [Jeotgalibacillus proteolyticus]|uniref:Uncharacterized protein n=1 Tax=Jeotgalibacillus proteolyticus TaxID=2082395 RepID=A0A2S5GA33_9BACL|nr:mechanosensitive ion channel [Jeotgalibacillus proteolyticus]PPA69850.1 hypothetical protein C4B60_15070 [Jeotgalibacillus proteolyticus]